MKYKIDLSEKLDLSTTPASGYAGPLPIPFYAWQPSTWPAVPAAVDENFVETLKKIFEQSILVEINNVIEDAKERTGGLKHRGHVIAIALMCALEAISRYGYRGHYMSEFIRIIFPSITMPLQIIFMNCIAAAWCTAGIYLRPRFTRAPNESPWRTIHWLLGSRIFGTRSCRVLSTFLRN